MNTLQQKLTYEDCGRSCEDPKALAGLKDQVVLITGGTGFIGKWIVEMINYLNEGHSYNIKTYLLARDVQRFKKEVPHLINSSLVEFIPTDVRSVHDLPEDINYVIHAAGTPDSREHISQPLKTIDTFFKGTQAILEAAIRIPNLKKIVHMSSNQIYGDEPVDKEISESYTGMLRSDKVSSVYAETKRMAECLCATYKSVHALPIVICRPFSFIGPYQSLEKPWAINNFIRDALLGKSIRILGDERTTRSYLYGSDMAHWLLTLLMLGQPGETFNMGGSNAITLLRLAENIKTIVNQHIAIEFRSSRDSYSTISKAVPDLSKLRSRFGLSEKIDLYEALENTVRWNKLLNL